MTTPTAYQQSISPADALWALYQSQTKRVRRAFRQRILEEEQNRVTKEQQEMVEESLTNSFNELYSGQVKHDARNLFSK